MAMRLAPRSLCVLSWLAVSLGTPITVSSRVALAQSTPTDGAGALAASEEDEQKARAHFRLGRAHYDNGEFAEAAQEFSEAYRISQRSALLYNLYLAYRDANDWRGAADALQKYLLLEKDIENRAQLESRLAALERSLSEGTAPPAPAQTQPASQGEAAAQPAATPASDSTQPGPAAATESAAPHKESLVLPIVLMGSGGALIIGSVVTGAMASSKQSQLEKACPDKSMCDPKNKALETSGRSLAVVSTVMTIAGIAAAGVGATLLVLSLGKSGESDRASAPTASVACLPGACAGAVRVAF